MATILRSSDAGRGAQTSAFNFGDLSADADKYVKQIREQAAKIVAEANAQAEKIRKQAELDGLQAAERKLQARVDAETGRRAETLLPALRTAIAELKNSKQAWLAHWEATGVRLATRIAERILRRELTDRPELPVALVRESLELSVGADGVRILLSPQDHAALGEQVERVVAELKPLGKVEITADEKIAPGGCRLETVHGSIDQQLSVQLRRIEEELT